MGLISRIFRSRDAPRNATAGSGYSFLLGSSASGKAVNSGFYLLSHPIYCI